MKKEHVYLDYAASTPIDPEVLEIVHAHMQTTYGNSSSLHHTGREARHVLEQSRATIAEDLHCLPSEIFFTDGGTHGDNVALLGTARAYKHKGKHIIVSAIEHKAVLETAKQLESEGFEISYIPVDSGGIIDAKILESLIRPDTILVSVMYANNEIGTVQPLSTIREILNTRPVGERPLLHTDACQAMGQLPMHMQDLGVDILTLSGSKIYGPKGVGVLYKKTGVDLHPILYGGGQESGIHPGTLNTPLIAGLATAIHLSTERLPAYTTYLQNIQTYCMDKLHQLDRGISINGDIHKRLPNNIHITIPFIEGEACLLMLDDRGIAVSTGSACASSALQGSHVMRALGVQEEHTHSSIRITYGRYTTIADIDYLIEQLAETIDILRSQSALTIHTS